MLVPDNVILTNAEIETLLFDIRGRLILHAKNETAPDDADEIFTWTERLCTSIELADSLNGKYNSQPLSESVYALKNNSNKENRHLIRASLDTLTALEAAVISSTENNSPFEIDIADFIDASFGELMPRQPEMSIGTSADEPEGFEIDAELLEVFSGEADELLRGIEECLDKLVANPEDTESLWEIRRNAHTFKGAAGAVGLISVSRIAHRIEDLLERASEKKAGSDSSILELLQTATTCLRAMTTVGGEQPGIGNLGLLHSAFDAALSRYGSDDEPSLALHKAAIADSGKDQAKVEAETESTPQSGDRNRSIIRVPLEKLDDLETALHDLVFADSTIGRQLAALDRKITELLDIAHRVPTESVEIDVLDEQLLDVPSPLNSVDYLSETRAFDLLGDIHQNILDLTVPVTTSFVFNDSLDAVRGELNSLFYLQKRNIKSIQDTLKRIRMVEFGTIKTRLQRTARVTADELGRGIELSLVNETSKLDTQMLDLLSEPLMHLVRNAVVHGIEPPEIRRLLGKNETGQITVAFANENTQIVLSVADDGSGIAASRLKEKAVAAGILTRSEAHDLTEREALRLIFEPGLTTAEKLSMSAGRGIGMSIVKAGIEAGGGSIDIDSKAHSGTCITIRIPSKIALDISESVVEVNNETMPAADLYQPTANAATVIGLTILIVDDSPSVRHATAKIVENAGWHPVTAGNGIEALEYIANADELPAIILTDIEMPRMNGFELIRSLRANNTAAKIPIVVVTSLSWAEHREMAERMGITKFLTKPLNESELIETIGSLVAQV